MELDTMSLGIGLLAIMVQVICVIVVIWSTNRISAGVKKVIGGQETIMSFMAKDYQDRVLLKVQERTAPVQAAGGTNEAEVLKEVGARLQDEIRTGKVFDNWPRIIGALNAGVMPPKNGSAAPAPETSTGPGAADPPAPVQGKRPPTGKDNVKGMAALKAMNDKRKAEAAARKAGADQTPPAPPIQAADQGVSQ